MSALPFASNALGGGVHIPVGQPCQMVRSDAQNAKGFGAEIGIEVVVTEVVVTEVVVTGGAATVCSGPIGAQRYGPDDRKTVLPGGSVDVDAADGPADHQSLHRGRALEDRVGIG
jgi:hypothetical protein